MDGGSGVSLRFIDDSLMLFSLFFPVLLLASLFLSSVLVR